MKKEMVARRAQAEFIYWWKQQEKKKPGKPAKEIDNRSVIDFKAADLAERLGTSLMQISLALLLFWFFRTVVVKATVWFCRRGRSEAGGRLPNKWAVRTPTSRTSNHRWKRLATCPPASPAKTLIRCYQMRRMRRFYQRERLSDL